MVRPVHILALVCCILAADIGYVPEHKTLKHSLYEDPSEVPGEWTPFKFCNKRHRIDGFRTLQQHEESWAFLKKIQFRCVPWNYLDGKKHFISSGYARPSRGRGVDWTPWAFCPLGFDVDKFKIRAVVKKKKDGKKARGKRSIERDDPFVLRNVDLRCTDRKRRRNGELLRSNENHIANNDGEESKLARCKWNYYPLICGISTQKEGGAIRNLKMACCFPDE